MSGCGASSGAVLERRASFSAELGSAGAARRFLRDVLTTANRDRWRDGGELALSEVVTNAILHAHTEIEVRIEVRDDHAHVEVRDFNPVLPLQRHYEDEATTGRGMGLVASVALECGVESLGEDGKVTWFRVGDPPEQSVDDLLAAWEMDEAWELQAEASAVVLRAIPVTLWLSAQQHHDAILRELVLYLAEHEDVTVDLAAADMARSLVSTAVEGAVDHAQQSGTAKPAVPHGHPSPLPWVPLDLTLELSVPDDAASGFAALQDALDVAEGLAVAGKLLVRPALPEVVAVRDWLCEQVIAQLVGTAPAPWAGTAQERFETAIRDREHRDELQWDATAVLEADGGMVAADDANRIVAVSRSLAELVGWDVEDLIGRRVVTLIPARLREAHVAGFSRHLSTGESHILGVSLELPVLRMDGTEVLCRFLVEQVGGTAGRSIYLASITPATWRDGPPS